MSRFRRYCVQTRANSESQDGGSAISTETDGDIHNDGLRAGLDELRNVLDQVRAKGYTLLRDIVVLDLAAQVYVSAEGTDILAKSVARDMAYVTARYAFEAACDLMYLLEVASDSNVAAARAYVAAQLAARKNIGLLNTSSEATGQERLAKPEPLKVAVERDAAELDLLVPGTGTLLRAALAARKDQGEKHWTGMKRAEMIQEIQAKSSDPSLGALLRSYWAILSSRGHPRGRFGERVYLTRDAVRVQLTAQTDDPGPASVATAATQVAASLISTHVVTRTGG